MASTSLQGQREAHPVSALGRLPAMVHALRLRQFMAAQPGEGLHRSLYVGQYAPREARALECGRLEVLNARVQRDHSPSTATIANRPPLVRTFAEKLSGGSYLVDRQRLACRFKATLSFLVAPHPE